MSGFRRSRCLYIMKQQEDITVFGVRAETFPDEIKEAFDGLMRI